MLMVRKILLLAVSFCVLGACRAGGSTPPTPFPTVAVGATPQASGTIMTSITELSAAPGIFADTTLQLTGSLRRQPIIVCETDLHLSPASWGLAEEGLLVPAGGFDEQVRALLTDDQVMTVEGRWRFWKGLVGCGKHAVEQEMWYLDVARILSPSPLVQGEIAAGTTGIELTVEGLPTEGGPSSTPSGELLTPQTPEQTVTSEGLPTAAATFPPPGATLTGEGETSTATAGTASLTGTPPSGNLTTTPAGTTTPSASGTPGTPTPGGSVTPSSPTPGAGQIVDRGSFFNALTVSDYTMATLASGTADRWSIDLFEDEGIYIYAVAATPADIVLSVMSDGVPLVNMQNSAPAGSPEFVSIAAADLTASEEYEVQVSANGAAAEYALTIYTDPTFPIVFNGILTSGSPRSAVQMSYDSVHYWFFQGQAGDELSMTVTPKNNGDPGVDLFGPGPVHIATADDGFDGFTETYETTLTSTGLHGLRIEEYSVENAVYDLVVTFQ